MLTKIATKAEALKVGDDVVSATHGRFTVGTIEPAGPTTLRIVSMHGAILVVSKRQLFFRFTKEGE